MENERLQKRLAELRARAPSPSAPMPGPSTSPVYSLRSSTVSRSSAPSVPLCSPEVPSALYSQHVARSYDNFDPSSSQVQGAAYELHGLHVYSGQYAPASSTQPTDEDLGDETSRRKRVGHLCHFKICITHWSALDTQIPQCGAICVRYLRED